MSKHTPGDTPKDLTVKKADPRFKRVFNRLIVYEVGSESEGVGYAVVPEDYRLALLFSAAPDLYAACKEALQFIEDSEGGGPRVLTNMLRAAIAKAEGGAL